MDIKNLTVGKSIFVDVERDGMFYTLKSKITGLTEGGVEIIPPSDNEGAIKYIKDTDCVHIRLSENGKMVKWLCNEWKESTRDNLKILICKLDSHGVNVNRREAFRVEVNKEFDLTFDNRTTKAYLNNISQLGVAFTTEKQLKVTDIVKLTILDLGMNLKLTARVIREETKSETEKLYGAVIVNSSPELRRYIANKQIEEINKFK